MFVFERSYVLLHFITVNLKRKVEEPQLVFYWLLGKVINSIEGTAWLRYKLQLGTVLNHNGNANFGIVTVLLARASILILKFIFVQFNFVLKL